MERTVTIKNVQVTKADLEAALVEINKPKLINNGRVHIGWCIYGEATRNGSCVDVGLYGADSDREQAVLYAEDFEKIHKWLNDVQDEAFPGTRHN